MSKRKNKKLTEEVKPQLTEEMIKGVFELFAPNKVQLFFMKLFGVRNQSIIIGNWFTDNVDRVKTLQDILHFSAEEVYKLELKYYLGVI